MWIEKRPRLECCLDLFDEFVRGCADRRVPKIEIDLVAKTLLDDLDAQLKERYQKESDDAGNGGISDRAENGETTLLGRPIGVAPIKTKRPPGRPRKVL